ncbi:MAG: hypothetical protein GX310_04800 [Synergistaceae bacterium]|nr:hypothetical protein [Synergistaceae bacterium]
MIEEKIMRTIRNLITGNADDSRRAGGLYEVTSVLAEKESFFSTGKLNFSAKFRVNETDKEVIYNEALIEKIMGLEAGFGRGFSRFGPGPQKAEPAKKPEGYTFRFRQIREAVKKAVEEEGYTFRHHLWGSL